MRKPYRIDLTGNRYGRLVVLSYHGSKQIGKVNKGTWLCKCDCGNEKVAIGEYLRQGHTTSCGCYHKEKFGDINRKHNLSAKCGRLYPLWKSIKYRCFSTTSKDYARYGGRGIVMCDEWKNDFSTFAKWALDNGYKEDKTEKGLNVLTIDRIDVNGNYEPNNCRFITNSQQAKNKRNSMSDDERKKKCPICGRIYISDQRKGQKTCGMKCGQILRVQTRKNNEKLQSN